MSSAEYPHYPRSIEPVHPPAGYIGGKRRLAKQLVALIDGAPHTTYAEAFVGMGGVFLRRRRQPRAEVINDYSGDVSNLFRILQRHYPQFMDTLRFQVTGRREFERLKASDPATLTDLERAGRFLYLQRTAFGGKVSGRNFGVSPSEGGAFDLNKGADHQGRHKRPLKGGQALQRNAATRTCAALPSVFARYRQCVVSCRAGAAQRTCGRGYRGSGESSPGGPRC